MTSGNHKSPTNPAYDVVGEHAAQRLLRSQKLQTGSPYLYGEDAPTPNQVGAVLHALADHTLNTHMLGPAVAAIGADRDHLGSTFSQASGLGRWFQGVGDYMSGGAAKRLPTAAEIEKELAWVMKDRCPSCLLTYPVPGDEFDADIMCPTPRDEECTVRPPDGRTADSLRANIIEQLIHRGIPTF